MISSIVPLLLEAALRALVAAVAVWTGLRVLRVGNVMVQKAAWGLVLIAALAMPLAPHWQGLSANAALRLPGRWSQRAAAASVAVPAAAAMSTSVPAESANPGSTSLAPADKSSSSIRSTAASKSRHLRANRSLPPTVSNVNYDAPAQPAALPEAALSKPASVASHSAAAGTPGGGAAMAWVVYLGVFAVLLLRLVVGLASAVRLWLMAEPATGLGESGLRLRASARVASPVNIGSGILLPEDYVEWDEEKLRIVLAHEGSHVRQGDFYLQIAAAVYASLFWFSPLGWWLKRKLNELSEAISDRAGLEEADSRSSYAQLLLEFAALPRPTLTGVAMARNSHLAQRIERLLNESSFHHAFAAGGRRALLAFALVPGALLAATALVRVEAATAPAAVTQPSALAMGQTTGQSTPEQVTEPAPAAAPTLTPSPAQATAPAATPAPPSAVDPGPVVSLPPNPVIVNMPAMPPMPPLKIRIPQDALRLQIDSQVKAEIAAARLEANQFRNLSYYDSEPYALVGDPGSKTRISGGWDGDRAAEIEKARKVAHGHFLWFRHGGKSYVVDDPAVVAQIEAMNKPVDDLGAQMRALGQQMHGIGEQQKALGKQMSDVSVPAPDLSKEMEELNAAVATLKAKQGGTINQKELGDLQREVGRIQGQLGALQAKINVQQVFGGIAKFSAEQGKLGGEMGKLGAQMGQLARENQQKVKGIIDESLKDGKAKPVE